MKKAKYSTRDSRGMLVVDCAECVRGGNGDGQDRCASGWKIKRGNKGCCFSGVLLPKLTVI